MLLKLTAAQNYARNLEVCKVRITWLYAAKSGRAPGAYAPEAAVSKFFGSRSQHAAGVGFSGTD